MKRYLLIVFLLAAAPAFSAGDENDRYRVVTTTVNLAGNDIPVALMFDSRTGASWYLALAQTAGGSEERVPAWQEIRFFPDWSTTPSTKGSPAR